MRMASFSGVGRFSSLCSCAELAALSSPSSFSPSSNPPSLPVLKESRDRERLVKSVSPVPESTSPFHECARSLEPLALMSSCGLLVPDGSNAALSSLSALALRVSRVARTSLREAASGKSS